jgi:hypothetical protein
LYISYVMSGVGVLVPNNNEIGTEYIILHIG